MVLLQNPTRIAFRNEQRLTEPHKHVKHDNFENFTKWLKITQFWGLGILFHLISPFLKKKIKSPDATPINSQKCVPLVLHKVTYYYTFMPIYGSKLLNLGVKRFLNFLKSQKSALNSPANSHFKNSKQNM